MLNEMLYITYVGFNAKSGGEEFDDDFEACRTVGGTKILVVSSQEFKRTSDMK
jgi:hypothetical protein